MEAVNRDAAIAQQVERILGKDEVSSSNLDSSSKVSETFGFRRLSFYIPHFLRKSLRFPHFEENNRSASLFTDF